LQQGFMHRLPGGEVVAIEEPLKYIGLSLADRPAVVKLHGGIDRADSNRDSYVVTEDDYINYLARHEVGALIPRALRERMEDGHVLFLGYSMRDLNLRLILSRIWGEAQVTFKSWAVVREPDIASALDLEETLWRDRGVTPLFADLRQYTESLEPKIAAIATR
jgi:hypothetical protein